MGGRRFRRRSRADGVACSFRTCVAISPCSFTLSQVYGDRTRTLLTLKSSSIERLDRVGDVDEPPRILEVEILDKFAIDETDALAVP